MARKRKLLIALAALFVALLVYRAMHPFRQAQVDQLTYTGAAEPGASSVDPGRLEVMLRLFVEPPPVSGAVIEPGFLKPVPGLDLTPPPPPDPAPAAPPSDPASPPPDPGAIVDRELGRFQVIGFFIQKEEAALFLQREKQVLVVREGDLIDGKYRVVDISSQKMTLRAIHLDELVHLDLTQYLNASERARLAELEGE
ncbi:MAG: hypothetical protein ACLFRG_08780 [Desulfococcaceae bacterium]